MNSISQKPLIAITLAIILPLTITNCTQQQTNIEDDQNQVEKELKHKAHEHQHKHYEHNGHEHDGYKHEHVEDRTLNDWEGTWSSIYPFVMDGSLDAVTDNLAKKREDKTPQQYKELFKASFKTDIEGITVRGNTVTFIQNGESYSAQYKYNGFKTPKSTPKNNTRYLFDKVIGNQKAPQLIQLNDQSYRPERVKHFQIYIGNSSHEEIIKNTKSFPSYWPEGSTGEGVRDDMLGSTAHNH